MHILRADIQILIDTRLKNGDINKIKNQADIYNYSCEFQNRNDNSAARGILILTTRDKDIETEILFKSDDGNFIIIKVKYDNRKILLAATYGPNKDNALNENLRNLSAQPRVATCTAPRFVNPAPMRVTAAKNTTEAPKESVTLKFSEAYNEGHRSVLISQ